MQVGADEFLPVFIYVVVLPAPIHITLACAITLTMVIG